MTWITENLQTYCWAENLTHHGHLLCAATVCSTTLQVRHMCKHVLKYACTPILTLQCGVNTLDPQAGRPPRWRRGGKTRELFAQCGDIWDSEDNLITVVALQETSLDRGATC